MGDWSVDQHSPKDQDFLRTDELLSWIAYRKSLRAPRWPSFLFKLKRDWRFSDAFGLLKDYFDPEIDVRPDGRATYWSKGEQTLSRLLTWLAENHWRDAEEELLLHSGGVNTSGVKSYLKAITGLSSISPLMLKEELTSDMATQRVGFQAIWRAAGELRRRLFAGELRSWGTEAYRSSPPVELHKDFWMPGTTINYDGRVTRLGTSMSASRELAFETAEALKIWLEPRSYHGTTALTRSPPSDTLRSRGGRRTHEALPSFIRALIELADGKDGLPDYRDLQKHMENWAHETFKETGPSRTTIQNWLRDFDYRRPIKPKT